MVGILGNPTTSFIDKIKNIVFAFAIMLAWASLVMALLNYLNMTSEYNTTPEFKFFMSCIWAACWEEVAFRWAPIAVVKRVAPNALWPDYNYQLCNIWMGTRRLLYWSNGAGSAWNNILIYLYQKQLQLVEQHCIAFRLEHIYLFHKLIWR